jgi:hypothetical protein
LTKSGDLIIYARIILNVAAIGLTIFHVGDIIALRGLRGKKINGGGQAMTRVTFGQFQKTAKTRTA